MRGSGSATELRRREEALYVHVFTVSATLVGACLTVLGLLRLIDRLRPIASIADDLLTVDTVLFLFACGTAYAAIRSTSHPRQRVWERIADLFFLTGLTTMTIVAVLLTYALA